MNSRFNSYRQRVGSRPSAGFSLVELLTVIAIISILLTVGAIGLGGITGGKNVTSGVTTTEALFSEARALAVGKGTRTRVLVNVNDPQDRENYLKRVLVIQLQTDANGVQQDPASPGNWDLTSRGSILPDGVYFSKKYSRKSEDDATLNEMNLIATATIKQPYVGKYVYFEFNSEGICETPGARFVIGSGARTGNGTVIATASAKRDFGGFAIWRNGNTSLFRAPDQMDIDTNVKEF